MFFEDELRAKNVLYVSGYKNYDSKVTFKCAVCGHEWEQTFHNLIQSVRGNRQNNSGTKRNAEHYIPCPKCREDYINLWSQQKRTKEQIEENRKFFARFRLWLKKNTTKQYKRKCKNCGKSFLTFAKNQICCSSRCGDRYADYKKRIKRNSLLSSRRKDKGITLDKLYKRDKGVCYLCGSVCDKNDFKMIDSTFIVGKRYPTIEHVIPVSKGGTDTWDNVRLAHMLCNSAKSGKLFEQTTLF